LNNDPEEPTNFWHWLFHHFGFSIGFPSLTVCFYFYITRFSPFAMLLLPNVPGLPALQTSGAVGHIAWTVHQPVGYKYFIRVLLMLK
jgi:hypothetical protein